MGKDNDNTIIITAAIIAVVILLYTAKDRILNFLKGLGIGVGGGDGSAHFGFGGASVLPGLGKGDADEGDGKGKGTGNEDKGLISMASQPAFAYTVPYDAEIYSDAKKWNYTENNGHWTAGNLPVAAGFLGKFRRTWVASNGITYFQTFNPNDGLEYTYDLKKGNETYFIANRKKKYIVP